VSLDPATTAFLFPGQGSQSVGMGKTLAEAETSAAAIFARADQILGYELSKISWQGPSKTLGDTRHTQPALLTHSLAVLSVLRQRMPEFQPAYCLGHSLGEISALVAAGAIDFEDGIFLVQERGASMSTAGDQNPGGMAAVLGMDLQAVEAACQQASQDVPGGVWVANDNCPGQVVISGNEDALEVVADQLLDQGARRVIRLDVSIAAHSPLMDPAQKRFNLALENIQIHDPNHSQVVGNVSAEPLDDAPAIRADLSSQLTSRVRWTESIQYLANRGIRTFIEIGSGTVLTGLLRRIDRNLAGFALDIPESFEPLTA
jgi:[acyl-carrier-protein] S-malonyltransferase